MSLVMEAGYQGWPALWAYSTRPLSASITSRASAAAGALARPVAAQATAAHIKLCATKDRVEDITARGPILSRASETPYGQKVCLGRSWMKGKKQGAPFLSPISPRPRSSLAVHGRRKRPKFGRLG